jgi:hypothetical protein
LFFSYVTSRRGKVALFDSARLVRSLFLHNREEIMDIRITKLRAALAALFVLAGVGLGNLLSPLVGDALATVGSTVNISDHSSSAYFAKVDSSGALKTTAAVTGRVAPAAPASPWHASEDIQSGKFIIGPSTAPIDITSVTLSTLAPSDSSPEVYLFGDHVSSSATDCSGAAFDVTLWHILNAGGPTTPVSVSFPTPLQFKPPANTKACVFAYGPSVYQTTLNAVGFYG